MCSHFYSSLFPRSGICNAGRMAESIEVSGWDRKKCVGDVYKTSTPQLYTRLLYNTEPYLCNFGCLCLVETRYLDGIVNSVCGLFYSSLFPHKTEPYLCNVYCLVEVKSVSEMYFYSSLLNNVEP